MPILEIKKRKLRLVMCTVHTNGALFRKLSTWNWEDSALLIGRLGVQPIKLCPRQSLSPKCLHFFYSSLNEDSEIAFDQFKSNLIEKLLNPQLPWNINIRYLKVLSSHVGTSSNPIKLTAEKKRQHCTRNQKTRTLALTLPKEEKKSKVHDLSFVF